MGSGSSPATSTWLFAAGRSWQTGGGAGERRAEFLARSQFIRNNARRRVKCNDRKVVGVFCRDSRGVLRTFKGGYLWNALTCSKRAKVSRDRLSSICPQSSVDTAVSTFPPRSPRWRELYTSTIPKQTFRIRCDLRWLPSERRR